ncbi:hypothetical protein LCGC14_2218290 [marine sediment metagenome]|uniref:Uncharacterized protein n=1 Tax=marine sediment metagenome TaxID=412755 RepID=A0A0F9G7B8_9ZZZZ
MNNVENNVETTVVKEIRLICRECNKEMPSQKGGFWKCITAWCECFNFQVEVELVIK